MLKKELTNILSVSAYFAQTEVSRARALSDPIIYLMFQFSTVISVLMIIVSCFGLIGNVVNMFVLSR